MIPLANTICGAESPLISDSKKEKLFLEAVRQAAGYHYERSPEIAFLYKRANFTPDMLQNTSDLHLVPSVGVTAMKTHLLLSRPIEKAILKLTSSGTKGQKTQVFFDDESLERAQTMLWGLWRQEGFVSDRPTNYLMFIYDPKDANDLGISFSINNQLQFAPANEVFFAIRKNSNGEWAFDAEGVKAKLRAYAKDYKPVRILGMPAFIFEFLESLSAEERFELPDGSAVLTGGGWKAAEDRSITREQFRERLTRALGVEDSRIRDGFGMAEHSAPYMECAHHRFHVPVYNKVTIRNPNTLAPAQPGEPGLLELMTPFNSMMPTLNVLTTDFGHIDHTPCTCGYNTPTFTLLGRAGLSKHKGCALTATDIVKRREK